MSCNYSVLLLLLLERCKEAAIHDHSYRKETKITENIADKM
jgi:hypothetical protein